MRSGTLLRRGTDSSRGPLLPRAVDQFEFLGAQRPFDNWGQTALPQQRLEDDVLIGIDVALDDVFAQAVGGVDQHGVAKSGLGVDREHHSGAAAVRANHPLHADRQPDFQVVEVLLSR